MKNHEQKIKQTEHEFFDVIKHLTNVCQINLELLTLVPNFKK